MSPAGSASAMAAEIDRLIAITSGRLITKTLSLPRNVFGVTLERVLLATNNGCNLNLMLFASFRTSTGVGQLASITQNLVNLNKA